MAPQSQRAKRRKSVPSAREQAAFGATAHKNKKKKKEAPLKATDVEAAHDP